MSVVVQTIDSSAAELPIYQIGTVDETLVPALQLIETEDFITDSSEDPTDYSEKERVRDVLLVLGQLATNDPSLESTAATALERIVIGHSKVLKSEASKFFTAISFLSVDIEDLTQAGIEGVYDALSRMDPDRPELFKAYSRYRIFDFMFKESAQAGGAVNLPAGALKTVIKARRINKGLTEGQDLDTLLSDEDMTLTQYQRYNVIANLVKPLSFEVHVGDEEATRVQGEPTEHRAQASTDPADLYEKKVGRELLYKAIQSLKERDQVVVALHYDLGGDGSNALNLREIGVILGLTESRICQIMTKVKKSLAEKLAEN
jgi:RNA polymerase sigma factor for flagellar operon FliA